MLSLVFRSQRHTGNHWMWLAVLALVLGFALCRPAAAGELLPDRWVRSTSSAGEINLIGA